MLSFLILFWRIQKTLFKSFAATGLNFTLAFRNLKVIGEAATQIPEGVRQTFTDFPWRRLVAKRHRLIMGVWGDISMRLAHYSK